MSGTLTIEKISITELQVDAIVNAANNRLRQGGGVCGAIFAGAGPVEMQKACDQLGQCETGSAVTTPGFRLKAEYVIHGVGPVWNGGGHGEAELLFRCYQAAMDQARNHFCHSVAFPLISSGIYGYPLEEAWEIALRAIRQWQRTHMEYQLDVVMAVIDQRALELGNSILKEMILRDQAAYPGRVREFAEKWRDKFCTAGIDYVEILDHHLADDCAELGFLMDCGQGFAARYGSAMGSYLELGRVIGQVEDIALLGSAIYSQWRYYNHWAYSGESILNPENRAWFIMALNRLLELAGEKES